MKRFLCLLLLCVLLTACVLPQVAAAQGGNSPIALEPEDEKEPPAPLPEAQPVFDPIWPADKYYEISCLYYYATGREHSTRYSRNHSIDIAGDGNALAVEDGVIETVDYLYNSFGNFIVILHNNGGRSLYAHLARSYVEEGDVVEKGDIIGVIGSTGKSAAVHLHYEYSLADPWLTFYKDKYYKELSYEQNCYYNNDYYNDSEYICGWLTENYVKREDYYYWNGKTPALEQVDVRYPTHFWAAVTAPTTAYQWVDYYPVGTIAAGTECLVEQVYESGWCRVLLRWEEAKMGYLTAYVPTSTFFDPAYTPLTHVGLTDNQSYTSSTANTHSEVVSAEKKYVEVGRSGDRIQIITEFAKDVRRLVWIEPAGDKLEGITVGNSFTATLSDLPQENMLVNRDGTLSMDDPLSVKNTAWAFVYQDNGYYTISDPLTGEFLTAQADGTLALGKDEENEAALWMLCGTTIDAVVITSKIDGQILSADSEGALMLDTYHAGELQSFMLDCEMIYDLRYDGNGGSAHRSTVTGLGYEETATVSNIIPKPISYTLRFDAAGGVTDMTEKTLTPVFTGWNSRQDGSGNDYRAGDTLPILGTTTLYAQWERLELGTLPTPTREGYIFSGWYTSAEGGLHMTDTSTVNHSITLYAHWTVETSNTGTILLCILAGLVLLVILVIVLFFVQKKKNAERQAALAERHRHHI